MATQKSKSKQQPQEQQSAGQHTLFVGEKWALIGGLLAAGVALLGQLLVGRTLQGVDARHMLSVTIPSIRAAGGSIITASGTILALMLTLLGLTNQASSSFDTVFYKRIERISLLATIALSGSVLILLLLSVPLQESQNISSSWYQGVYYVLIALIAAMAGLLIAIVLMLYNAIKSLLQVLSPISFSDVRDPLRQSKSSSSSSSAASSSTSSSTSKRS